MILVTNTEPNFTSKNHVTTLHEVLHHIFQSYCKCFEVNQEEVDFIVCRNLETDIPFNIKDLPRKIFGVIVYPAFILCHFVILKLKEQDLVG